MSAQQIVASVGIASVTFIMWKLLNKKCFSSVVANNASKLLRKSDNHLILHFDINKTIVMSDSVQDKALKGVINDTISECSWGEIYDINDCPSNYYYNKSFIINNKIWKPRKPYNITPIETNNNLISFMSWIKSEYPYPNGQTDQNIKNKRRSYTLRFIELFDNKITEISKGYIDKYNMMLNKMENGGEDGKEIFIIPSFWNCIHDLIAAKRSFSIIFRSFGTDIDDVMKEFNNFCKKYGYDGSMENIPNLILESKRIGVINCDIKNNQNLIIGINKRNPIDETKNIKNKSLKEFYKIDRMKWYKEKEKNNNNNNNVKIICNKQDIYQYIKNESISNKTMMFSDDYIWWSLHGENSDGGKIFIINDNDTNIHQIFFDDNLEFNRPGIVDVRKLNRNNGNICISDSEWIQLKKKHLLKVEPLEVILNDNYFTEHIAKFESAFYETK